MVDIGCSPGTAVWMAARRAATATATATGIDPDPALLRLARWITVAVAAAGCQLARGPGREAAPAR